MATVRFDRVEFEVISHDMWLHQDDAHNEYVFITKMGPKEYEAFVHDIDTSDVIDGPFRGHSQEYLVKIIKAKGYLKE